jgi:hypothetical protein
MILCWEEGKNRIQIQTTVQDRLMVSIYLRFSGEMKTNNSGFKVL